MNDNEHQRCSISNTGNMDEIRKLIPRLLKTKNLNEKDTRDIYDLIKSDIKENSIDKDKYKIVKEYKKKKLFIDGNVLSINTCLDILIILGYE